MVAQIDRDYLRTGVANVVVRGTSYVAFEGRPLTTRPRWVNSLVRPLLTRMADHPHAQTTEAPAFIVGLGRSGTTLLGQVLSTHPAVAWLNEPKLMWNVICPIEDVIGSYSPAHVGKLRMDRGDVSEDMRRRAHAVTSGYLKLVHRQQLLDKYPELIYRIPFVRSIFSDAKFLILQRRAVASASSIVRWGDENGNSSADWWGKDGKKWRILFQELIVGDLMLQSLVGPEASQNDPMLMGLIEWLLAAEESLRWIDDPSCMLVNYGEFVENPRAILRDIFDHLGLPQSESAMRFAESKCVASSSPGRLPAELAPELVERIVRAERELGLS